MYVDILVPDLLSCLMAMMIAREISKLWDNVVELSSPSDVLFDEHMTVLTSQQKFLRNTHNKTRFISMLKEKFTAENILVKQSNNDADVLTIETAIE